LDDGGGGGASFGIRSMEDGAILYLLLDLLMGMRIDVLPTTMMMML